MDYKPKMTFYEKNDRRKYHVVAVLDEPQGKQVVCKFYGLHKQWWHYEVKSKHEIDSGFKIGLFSITRNDPTKADILN